MDFPIYKSYILYFNSFFPFVSPIFTVVNTEKYSRYTLLNFINLIEGAIA